MAEPARVALFVTCLVDLFRPTRRLCRGQAARGCRLHGRGAARADLLRPAGLQFRRPGRRQGDRPPGHRRLCRLRLCRRAVGLLRRDGAGALSRAVRRRSGDDAPARAGTGRAHLRAVSFLVDVRGVHAGRRALCDGRVTYHDACSGLRELGVKEQPRRLLALGRRAAPRANCRGPKSAAALAARSASNIPEISDKMVTDKAADIAATGADAVLAGDLGCLLNIAGKLSRARQPGRGAPRRRGARRHDRRRSRRSARRRRRRDAADQPRLSRRTRAPGSADPNLQRALGLARTGFPLRRAAGDRAAAGVRGAARRRARRSRTTRSPHLDFYLELYEQNVAAARRQGALGAHRRRRRARRCSQICRSVDAKIVTKGKSMVAEEIALNDFLEANGITPVETDLGEYIIQLRHEPPSHIIAPAIHLMKEQVADDLPRRAHARSTRPARSIEPQAMCDEARTILRPQFLAADVGITGANFLIAETGSSIIVTNEGNGDLTQTLPQGPYRHGQHRKDRADAGGRRDLAAPAGALGDGPGILDLHDDLDRAAPAGRSRRARAVPCRAARQRPQRDARHRVPGHAALHPLRGLPQPLPGLCRGRRPCLWLGLSRADGRGADAGADRHRRGRASAECLDLLRPLRERLPGQDPAAEDDAALARARIRQAPAPRRPIAAASRPGPGWRARPALYHALAEIAGRVLGWARRPARPVPRLPLAGGWTEVRDMPAPEGRSFHSLWAERQNGERER